MSPTPFSASKIAGPGNSYLSGKLPAERFEAVLQLALRLFKVSAACIVLSEPPCITGKASPDFSIPSEDGLNRLLEQVLQKKNLCLSADQKAGSKEAQFAGEKLPSFYAGYPLFSPKQEVIGAFCLFDSQLHSFDHEDAESLKNLAELAQRELILNTASSLSEANLSGLREAANLFEGFAGTLPNVGVLVFDTELRYQLAIGKGLEAVGLKREMLEGKTIWEAYPPEVILLLEDDYRSTLAGMAAIRERVIKGRDYRAHFAPLKNEQGEITGGMVISQDITERKQAEEALRESEAKVTNILHSITDGFFVVDSQWRFTYLNPEAERLLQSPKEQLLGKNIWEEFPEAVSRQYYQQGHLAIEGKKVVSFTEYYPAPLDTWFEARAYPTGDGLSVYFRDVTGKRKAENELRDSEERYRILFEDNPHPMWVYDTEDLRFLAVNNAAVNNYGYSREEFAQLRITDIRPEEDNPKLLSDLEHAFRQLYSPPDRWQHRKKDGSIIQVEVSAHEVMFSGKKARLVLAIDVTARVQAEQALLQTEELLQAVMENAPIVLFATDDQGVINLSKGKGLEAIGLNPGEAIGKSVFEWLSEAPEALETARRLFTGQEVSTILNLSGTYLETHCVPVIDKDGKVAGAIGVAVNITAYKQAEEELLKTQLQLMQAQKMEAVGRLAGGVAHDFNNLLTAIIGYTDLSLQKTFLHDPLRTNLLEIKKAAEGAATLTQQLLAFSRKQILKPTNLNLNEVVGTMDKMLRRLIGEDIELVSVLEPDLQTVKADRGQISQVIMNLVVNARDAMPEGGILTIQTDNVELNERYTQKFPSVKPGSYVMISVTDTGCGMSQETLSHIFEPFFTTKEQGKGTGLGLSTVYGIVRQSEGHIWAYSEEGVGTVFKIYLPATNGQEETLAQGEHQAQETGIGSETILVVEDNKLVRGLVRKILDERGYRVLEAEDGQEAQITFMQEKGRIDLVLSDVVLPQMGGVELVQRLRQANPSLKVIFMSGYNQEEQVEEDKSDLFQQYLPKPFTREILLQKIREVLNEAG